jgi:hypothetical protein
VVGQNDLGTFEYLSSRKPPTLEHGQHSNYNFGRLFSRPNLFQNRKWDGFQSVNLQQPYDFGRQLVVAEVLAAVSSRRSKPDRRSLPDRLSPCDCFSASDRVSTPRRRSQSARLSKLDRLLASAIALSQIAVDYECSL